MAFSTFESWADGWMDLAKFEGPHLLNPDERISALLGMWDLPIPGKWERGIDPQLLGDRYRRGDQGRPNPGEHTIEHEILSDVDQLRCLDGSVADGINALPLARDASGGRRGNVEADLLLLLKWAGTHCLAICEVKHSSDTCWYAAVEGLRQLKLLQCSQAAQQLFRLRASHFDLPGQLPLISLVVAPAQYYSSPGKKQNALGPTTRLLTAFTEKTGIGACLTVWDAASRAIKRL